MTEQFSQEYKAFMQSDEAKGLQALWVPSIRDVVGVVDCDTVCLYSVQANYLSEQIGLQDEEGQFFGVFGELDELKEWALERDYMFWLPTLFQLIRVIEGAGQRFILMSPTETNHYWTLDIGLIEYNEQDLLLAAAQLAVRAIGGEG